LQSFEIESGENAALSELWPWRLLWLWICIFKSIGKNTNIYTNGPSTYSTELRV